MKKIVSLVLCTVLLSALLCVDVFASEGKEFVSRESDWQYLEYEGAGLEGPDGWATGEDDSNEWLDGTAPFGAVNGSVVTPISWNNFSCFMRKTFTVEDLSDVERVAMSIIYDEHPIVYINGQEVWSKGAGEYNDRDYTIVNLSEFADYFVKGENYIAVYFENAYGGAILDMDLYQMGTKNEDGSVVLVDAFSEGFVSFGSINSPMNVTDGNNSSCCGSNWDPEVEQFITVTLAEAVLLESVTVSCKDEGEFVEGYEGDVYGTYDVYAIKDGVETKLGTVDAWFEGETIEVSEQIEADSIKVVITSWNRTTWAAVADIWVYGESTEEDDPKPDVTPTPDVTPDATVTPEVTVTPDATVTPEVTVTPDATATPDATKTPDSTVAPETTTPAGTTTPTETEPNNIGIVIAVIVVAVLAVAGIVVFAVMKKKK